MAVIHNGLEPRVVVRHDQGIFDDQAANAVPDEKERPCLLYSSQHGEPANMKGQRIALTPPSRMRSTCSNRSSDKDCNVMPSARARCRYRKTRAMLDTPRSFLVTHGSGRRSENRDAASLGMLASLSSSAS